MYTHHSSYIAWVALAMFYNLKAKSLKFQEKFNDYYTYMKGQYVDSLPSEPPTSTLWGKELGKGEAKLLSVHLKG